MSFGLMWILKEFWAGKLGSGQQLNLAIMVQKVGIWGDFLGSYGGENYSTFKTIQVFV